MTRKDSFFRSLQGFTAVLAITSFVVVVKGYFTGDVLDPYDLAFLYFVISVIGVIWFEI